MKYILAALFAQNVVTLGVGFQSPLARGFSVNNLFLYLLLLAATVKIVASGVPGWSRNVQRLAYCLIALVSWTFLSIVLIRLHPQISSYSPLAGGILAKSQMLDPVLFFFLYYLFSQKPGDAEFLIKMFVLTMGAGAVITIGDVFGLGGGVFGYDTDSDRPNGPMGEPNQSAAIFALFVPLSLIFTLIEKRQLLWGAVTLSLFGALILTGSRGGLLGLTTSVAAITWILRRNPHSSQMWTYFVVLLPLLFLAFLAIPESYQEMLSSRFTKTSEAEDLAMASAGRTNIWAAGIGRWTESPIVGFGWGAFRHVAGHTSHNTYLEILVNLGLIGLMLYLFAFTLVLKQLWLAARVLDPPMSLIMGATIAGLCGLLVAVFFVNLYKPWLVVWALIGVTVAIAARDHAVRRAKRKGEGDARLHPHW